jgi:hypothetical protein
MWLSPVTLNEVLTIDMNRHAPSPLEGIGLLVPPRAPIGLLIGP